METYECFGCGKPVPEDDSLWVNPKNGEATTGEFGRPFHESCAPDDSAYLAEQCENCGEMHGREE